MEILACLETARISLYNSIEKKKDVTGNLPGPP